MYYMVAVFPMPFTFIGHWWVTLAVWLPFILKGDKRCAWTDSMAALHPGLQIFRSSRQRKSRPLVVTSHRMAVTLSFASAARHLKSRDHCVIFSTSCGSKPNRDHCVIFWKNCGSKPSRVRCNGQNPTSNSSTSGESEPKNALLKVAWYGSELLGIAASFFQPQPTPEAPQNESNLATERSELVDRAAVVATIKEDFVRSYFVNGKLTVDAYEEDCEFADPAGSFRGLRRFKRNCTNFGSLIERSNMKLMKWEDFEDKGVGHWRFSCIMSFPWRPVLSATGYTEYYFDGQSGKVCRHVEHWNIPKMALLRQILKPSRGLGRKRADS